MHLRKVSGVSLLIVAFALLISAQEPTVEYGQPEELRRSCQMLWKRFSASLTPIDFTLPTFDLPAASHSSVSLHVKSFATSPLVV